MPVHVGSGEMLDKLDYIVVGDELLVVDYGAITADSPKRSALLSSLSQLVLGKCSPQAMEGHSTFLKRTLESGEGFIQERVAVAAEARKGLTSRSARGVGEIWLMPSGPLGYYLPGSSIKGAIRTALIDSWISPPERQKFIIQRDKIVSEINRTRNKKLIKDLEKMSEDIVKNKIEFYDKGRNYFRNLRVSDVSLSDARMLVCKVIRRKKKPTPQGSDIPNYALCIDEGVKLTAELSILEGNESKISDKSIFESCKRFYGPRLIKTFPSATFNEGKDFFINLGRFSGAENKTFDELCCVNVVPPTKSKQLGCKIESEAKTMSQIEDGGLPLGWVLCRIEEVK